MPEPQPQPSHPVQGLLLVVCDRCGRNCQAGKADPKARLLRISETDEGLCLDCAVTEWLRVTEPICYMLGVHPQAGKWQQREQASWDHSRKRHGEERTSPEALLLPQVQECVAGIMRTGKAQADPANVNWKWIVSNWEIPFPPKRKRRKRRGK